MHKLSTSYPQLEVIDLDAKFWCTTCYECMPHSKEIYPNPEKTILVENKVCKGCGQHSVIVFEGAKGEKRIYHEGRTKQGAYRR